MAPIPVVRPADPVGPLSARLRHCGGQRVFGFGLLIKQNFAWAVWGPGLAHRPGVKGQRDLSFCNEFNWQRLETARIATLSQQIALRATTGFFPVIALTPHHGLDGGRGACGATSRLETRPQHVLVVRSGTRRAASGAADP
jgi:hypothetical protein